jgi:hypothetical protein
MPLEALMMKGTKQTTTIESKDGHDGSGFISTAKTDDNAEVVSEFMTTER